MISPNPLAVRGNHHNLHAILCPHCAYSAVMDLFPSLDITCLHVISNEGYAPRAAGPFSKRSLAVTTPANHLPFLLFNRRKEKPISIKQTQAEADHREARARERNAVGKATTEGRLYPRHIPNYGGDSSVSAPNPQPDARGAYPSEDLTTGFSYVIQAEFPSCLLNHERRAIK